MPLYIIRSEETLVASGAEVRHLSSVHAPLMALHVVLRGKSFHTVLASVWEQSSVNLFVFSELTDILKSLPTLATWKWAFASVVHFMVGKLATGLVFSSAILAIIFLRLKSMHPLHMQS